MVVVDVQQVVAHAAVQVVAPGATDQPVVAQIAKNAITAIVTHRSRGDGVVAVRRNLHRGAQHTFGLIEIQQELILRSGGRPRDHDLAQRVVLVVQRHLACTGAMVGMLAVGVHRVERQDVAIVVGPQPAGNGQVVHHHDTIGQWEHGVGRQACCRERQGLGARDGVVTRAAVQPVAAEATVDDVVVQMQGLRANAAGPVGLGARDAVLVGRAIPVHFGAERRDVDRLLQRATHVDGRRLHIARRVDELVEHIAVGALEVGVRALERDDAEQGLALTEQVVRVRRRSIRQERRGALAVAAREDAPVIADDTVVARSTGYPVVAPATENVVVLAIAEDAVVAARTVQGVVARLTVNLVAGADIAPCGDISVRTARRVVEQAGSVRHEPDAAVVVVVEGLEQRGRSDHPERCLDRRSLLDDADDVAVVTEDGVGVFRMAGARGRDGAVSGAHGARPSVVAGRLRARATEDDVAAVRPPERIGLGQYDGRDTVGLAEEVGTAADDVVLPLVAEDHVATAAAFDVVVPIGRRAVERGVPGQRAGGVATIERGLGAARRAHPTARADGVGRYDQTGGVVHALVGHETDRPVALNDIGAELTEDGVVALPAGKVVVASVHGNAVLGRLGVADLGDDKVAPHRRIDLLGAALGVAARVETSHVVGQIAARRVVEQGAVDLRTEQGLEAQAREHIQVRAAVERRVVAQDQVHAEAAVDGIVAGASEQHVLPTITVDLIGRTIVRRQRLDLAHTQRRLQRLRQRRSRLGGVARAGHVLRDEAVVADDDVVVVAPDVRRGRARLVAVNQVAPGEQRVEVRCARRPRRLRHGQHAGDEVDVEAGVAVEQVHATLAEQRVVARAPGDVVAGLAADDGVVTHATVCGEAHRRQLPFRNGRIQVVRVDHVVAGQLVGACEREDEEVGVLAQPVALHDGVCAGCWLREQPTRARPQRRQVSVGGQVLAEQIQRLVVRADLADGADQHAVHGDQAFRHEAGGFPVPGGSRDGAEGGLERAACKQHRAAEAHGQAVFMRHRLVSEFAERELVVLALVPGAILRGVAIHHQRGIDVDRGREAAGRERCATDEQRLAAVRKARDHQLRHSFAGRREPARVAVGHRRDRDLLADGKVQIGVPVLCGASDLAWGHRESAGKYGAGSDDVDGVATHTHGASPGRCERASDGGSRRQRGSRDEQRAAQAGRAVVVEVGDRVEIGHSAGRERDGLPDGKAEVLPRQVVVANDAVRRHGE